MASSNISSLITSDPTTQYTSAQTQLYQNFSPHMNPLSLHLDLQYYIFWSSQVLATARAHSLEGFLLGTILAPSMSIQSANSDGTTSQVPNPEYVLWIRHDQFLLSWLFSSISDSMLGHVNRCASSAEA